MPWYNSDRIGHGLLDRVEELLAVKRVGKEFQAAELHRLYGASGMSPFPVIEMMGI